MEPINYIDAGPGDTKIDKLVNELKDLLKYKFNQLFYKVAGNNQTVFPSQFDLLEKSWIDFLEKNKFDILEKDYINMDKYDDVSCLINLINCDKHKIKNKIILEDLWMDGTINPKFYLLIDQQDAQKIVALRSFLN